MSIVLNQKKPEQADELELLVDKRRALRVEVGELEARLRGLKRIDEVDAAEAKLAGLKRDIAEAESEAEQVRGSATRDAEAIRSRGEAEAQTKIREATEQVATMIKNAEVEIADRFDRARAQAEADSRTILHNAENLQTQARAVLSKVQMQAKALREDALAFGARLATYTQREV